MNHDNDNHYRDFYVGQEVVCIDDKVPLYGGPQVKDKHITEGEVYRIRWVGVAVVYGLADYLGVKLEGIESGFGADWKNDAPYAARRFRPLVKDPLAIFRRIATDPDFKIDAPEGPKRDKPTREGVPKREKEEV